MGKYEEQNNNLEVKQFANMSEGEFTAAVDQLNQTDLELLYLKFVTFGKRLLYLDEIGANKLCIETGFASGENTSAAIFISHCRKIIGKKIDPKRLAEINTELERGAITMSTPN